MTEEEKMEYKKLLKNWLNTRKKNTDFWNQFMTGSGIPPKQNIRIFGHENIAEAKHLKDIEETKEKEFEDFRKSLFRS